MDYPLINRLQSPKNIKTFTPDELGILAQELRHRISHIVRKKGGHLGPNLGVVEVLIACHYLFDFAKDRLVFDVGHQVYPHKLLTGRNDQFNTLRQKEGLSGYPHQKESPYDVFRGGHASTAISTALGIKRGASILAAAHPQSSPDLPHVLALVGDGSMTGGMSFEGLNQTGYLHDPLIVILNDNSMSISPTVGGLSKTLNSIRYLDLYRKLRDNIQTQVKRLPKVGTKVHHFTEALLKDFQKIVSPSQIFTALGFEYIGPIDGHDIKALIHALEVAKKLQRPVLIHARTEKGRGYLLGDSDAKPIIGPHALSAAAPALEKNAPPPRPSYSKIFATELLRLAKQDKRLIAITAAMRDGTGLSEFAETLPKQYFDVGICEAHATGFSAGLAASLCRPIFAVYSTFFQRAFDQVFHDIILQQNLPVIFAIDRAGLVGDDGPSHHGLFDIAYLRIFPSIILMAPKDAHELKAMLRFALSQNTQPCVIRYPKAQIPPTDYFHIDPFPLESSQETLPIHQGQAETLLSGERLCILAYGSMVYQVSQALKILRAENIHPTFINARFAKPLDPAMLQTAFTKHSYVLTVEEGSIIGGFGSAVLETQQNLKLPLRPTKILGIPDRLIEHASRPEQLATCLIDVRSLTHTIRTLWNANSPT